jgi:hypothetical protein
MGGVQVNPAELAARILALGPDHREALLELIAKAEGGAVKYGPLRLDDDPRDFGHEATQELLDCCWYLSMECARLRRELRRSR